MATIASAVTISPRALLHSAPGLLGWCPPYAMLGINTCQLGKKKLS
ncbi:MAG TPA: DUF2892 domain-containing protein [Oligoflexus sp.]|nr:DUF2892 domain-containing protein [Oligoflexus sp.]HET9241636.1 DUF2892 domain-containing protein [Oligoflexus sp.]